MSDWAELCDFSGLLARLTETQPSCATASEYIVSVDLQICMHISACVSVIDVSWHTYVCTYVYIRHINALMMQDSKMLILKLICNVINYGDIGCRYKVQYFEKKKPINSKHIFYVYIHIYRHSCM